MTLPAQSPGRAEPGAVVDVSNVCWSPELAPFGRHFPLLERLFAIRGAWHRQYGAHASLALVADNSLRRALHPDDRRELNRMERAGEVEFAPTADPVLLELARDRGWYVISADRFKDLRRLHPWIDGAPERFLAWEVADGTPRLRPSGIRPVPEQVVSRLAERKDLRREQHISVDVAAQKRLLRSYWRCTDPGCLKAMIWPARLLDWPTLRRDGTVVCTCGGPLEEAGPRGVTRMFVAADARTGKEFLRFPISVGSALLLGRGDLSHGINLAGQGLDAPPEVDRTSRRHLILSLEDRPGGPRAFAVDLGSGNGTVLLRGGAQRLAEGEPVGLGEQDRLVLGDVVSIRLSGRRYFTGDEERVPDHGTAGGGVTRQG
ncbi:FHA domain-containing protein [Kitasatospora sp. NPDC050543]|uniref:FHA domain-containing protein n=1 Tax=Kitasatospora sp. NPDC050543 TaxID=3364054 RepID=UPI0037957840